MDDLSTSIGSHTEHGSHFTNQQKRIANLPDLGDVDFEPLQKKYQTAGLLLLTILALIAVVALFTVNYLSNNSGEYTAYIIGGIGILYLLLVLYTYFGYYQRGYAVRQHDILYKKGLFWRSKMVIPFARIQHCEIDQGPIDRMFGLCSIKIFTAGGNSSDIAIPGLLPNDANKLKEYIIVKSGADEEE